MQYVEMLAVFLSIFIFAFGYIKDKKKFMLLGIVILMLTAYGPDFLRGFNAGLQEANKTTNQ